MEIKLIITENAQAAHAIALALGDIYNADGSIVKGSKKSIQKQGNHGYIHAKRQTDNFIVIWVKSPITYKNSDLMKIYNESGKFPYVPEKFEIELMENFSSFLTKLLTEKRIREVYLAYSPCLNNAIIAGTLANYLSRDTHVKTICLEIPAYIKKYILAAFDSPISDIQLKNSFHHACKKKLLSWSIEENISLAFSVSQNIHYKLNEYSLAVLALLYRRNNALNQRKQQLVAEIQVHEHKLQAFSKKSFYASEIEKLLEPGKIYTPVFKRLHTSRFMTTPDLFAFYDSTETEYENLAPLVESLFFKGFITNPYTLAETLPASFGEDDIKSLLYVCSNVSNEKLDNEYISSIRKCITKNRGKNEYPILPLSNDLSDLTSEEFLLYKYIVEKTVQVIKSNSNHQYVVKINNLDFICEVPQSQIKKVKRSIDPFTASLSHGTEQIIKPFRLDELMNKLADMRIGIIDDYINIPDLLQSSNIITLSGNQVSLHTSAKKLYNALPSKSLKSAYTFSKWEADMESGDISAEAMTKKDLYLTFTDWTPKILSMNNLGLVKNTPPLQQSEKSSKEDSLSSHEIEVSCPYCNGKLEVYTWGLACTSCNFAAPYTVYGKKLSPENYMCLLRGDKTSVIDDLVAKDGTTFAASIKIDKTGNVKLYQPQ